MDVYNELWPDGIVQALNEFDECIADNSKKSVMAQRMLAVSEIWKELTEIVGSPQLIDTPERKGIRLVEI